MGVKIPYLDKKKESKMNKNIYYDIKDGININCGHYIKKTNKICYNIGKKNIIINVVNIKTKIYVNHVTKMKLIMKY